MSFISISLDICESTDMKSKMRDKYKSEPDKINICYKKYFEKICGIELGLINSLKDNGINWEEDLFIIKNIGDEIWFSVNINEKTNSIDFNNKVSIIIRSLLDKLFGQLNLFIGFEESETDGVTHFKDSINFKNVVFKVFIDFIEDIDYINISDVKLDYYQKNYEKFYVGKDFEKEIDKKLFKEKYDKYILRNNVGIPMENEGKEGVTHRFDPIGYGIDKFFRCTKYALPGIITIGENLINNLYESEIKDNKIRLSTGEINAYKFDYYNIYLKNIPKGEMNGINEDYKIFYLFDENIVDGRYKNISKSYFKTKEELEKLGYIF
jgi:hypothetical protein